jgi:mono/diheme cytochrome c family protein
MAQAIKLTCSSSMRVYPHPGLAILQFLVFLLATVPVTAHGQETAQFFRQNCASCHTIGGGPLTGPDLKNVTQRQEREWLVNFIVDPTAVLKSGDAYAMKLKEQARGAVMTKVPGMTRARADALLQLIENESALEESQFKGIVVSTEPYTERDIEAGRQYVLGVQKLENGGPACIGCHSIRGTGLLGGGRLGPDLTGVYQRLGQDAPRKNLTAWLTAPATTTMAPVFKDHMLTADEIQSLVAFFEHAAQIGGEEDASGSLAFLLLGVIVAVCGLVGMDAIWRGRFRDVRRTLVALGRKPVGEGESVPS